MMKERSQHLLSEVGENIDYMRSDVRNLSRYIVELEELVEAYYTFASNAKLQAKDDKAAKLKLLKRTQKVIGPSPDKPSDEQITRVSGKFDLHPSQGT